MYEITNWNFSGQQVRTVEVNGEPWWVLSDVCRVLEISTPAKVSGRLDEDEKGMTSIHTLGGKQNISIINESGLYSVILRSDKPQAKPFRKWVTSEVLPTLRKTGSYRMQDSYQISDPVKRAQRWIEEQQARAQLEMQVAVQTQQIQELQPKASYYDVVLNCKDLLAISAIAKDYGKSAKWLNQYLHEKGVQYRQGEIWLLYQQYAEQGYTSTKTCNYNGTDGQQHAKVHTYWTQKGRLFIYELLKEDGIVPVMEREEPEET